MNKNIKRIILFGIPMDPWTMEYTVNTIHERIKNGVFTQHAAVNVAKLVNMQTDSVLRESVTSSDIINIDGMGIVWGARFLDLDVPERVAGIDLFVNLLEMSANENYPVFLLGAEPEVLEQAVDNLTRKIENLIIADYHHGYFWEDEEAVVQKIRRSGAKLIFVAVTSPKKEIFIDKWKAKLGVTFVMGVGGTFDVIAGKVKRAPNWMQNYGSEWLYRVFQEPGRMWKRYFMTNSKFLFLLLSEKIRHITTKTFS